MIDRAAASRAVGRVRRGIDRGSEAARAYLASPEGQRLRRRVARAMIVTAPLVVRSRVFRATVAGRIVGLVGGATVLVKVAEALRDWDPAPD